MKKLSKVLPWLPVLAALTPLVAAAQTLTSILGVIRSVIDLLIPLLMAVGVLVFIWGIVKYITAGGDIEKVKEARGYIIYGLIGLLVMVAFWGIIKIALLSFNIQEGGTIKPPKIPTS